MFWDLGVTCTSILSIASIIASVQAQTTKYVDSETGFTFAQYAAAYKIGGNILFRIAVPQSANSTGYDALLQVVAPIDVGWAGLAWGGQMLMNPLTVAWANNANVLVSSRYASTRSQPPTTALSPTTLYKTGTHVNKTHWQYTAKCSGCTSFTGAKSGSSSTNTKISLTATGTNQLAFAFASAKPSNPSSNTSAVLGVHDVYAYWMHDFSIGENGNWGGLVAKLK